MTLNRRGFFGSLVAAITGAHKVVGMDVSKVVSDVLPGTVAPIPTSDVLSSNVPLVYGSHQFILTGIPSAPIDTVCRNLYRTDRDGNNPSLIATCPAGNTEWDYIVPPEDR